MSVILSLEKNRKEQNNQEQQQKSTQLSVT